MRARPRRPSGVRGSRYDVKEGQSETEWLGTVVFSQWPIMRHADMPTTTKTLLPRSPAPKEQSAKADSAALRSKRKGTRIRSPPCFAIHL